jgi:molybdate transport system ATP-binding protein
MRDVHVCQGSSRLLDGITWTVNAGEHWALLGPNGSGKSTLLSLVLADHPQIYNNQVRVAGRELEPGHSIWEQKACVGWLSPELDAHYPPDTRAIDVVLSGFASSLGVHTQMGIAEERAARTWLDHLGLASFEQTPLSTLSPLDRRLVLLARAVVHQPLLVLCDEPCQGLDADERHTLGAAISAVVAALGMAMIYVTHDPDEVPASVQRVLQLDRGQAIYLGARDRPTAR